MDVTTNFQMSRMNIKVHNIFTQEAFVTKEDTITYMFV